MSSPVYEPVTRTGPDDKENRVVDKKEANDKWTVDKKDQGEDLDMLDSTCGFMCLRPAVLKPSANIGLFTAFYSLAALITSTLSTYVSSQVTTLEKQFGFSSKQTGLIMAANDIGYLVCVLFVSYSASRLHIPRSLGVATVIFGLSGIACSLPHFIFGAAGAGDTRLGADNGTAAAVTGPRKSSTFGDLCDSFNASNETCGAAAANKAAQSSLSTPEQIAHSALVIIVLGMMLQGFGKAPRSSLTITYLDDNTARVSTGFYMGIITAISILGPAVAYLMGGIFSKMYVTLEATKLTPRHPKWIGAWWLGYVLFGSLALLVSLPLFWFPRRMPTKHNRRSSVVGQKRIEAKDTLAQSLLPGKTEGDKPLLDKVQNNHGHQTKTAVIKKLKTNFLLKHVREFFATLFRLWTNPVYLAMVASGCFLIFTMGGISAYTPKYMERMFHLPTHLANYIIAGQTLCTSCIGTFIGGYLTRRMKMTSLGALKFVVLVVSLAVAAHFMGFVFQCDQGEVHNWPSQTNNCSDACYCRDHSYFPVCGTDSKTYYSPCQAGCGQVDNGVYHNCTCIPGGDAISGSCDTSCSHLYPYVVFMGLRALFGTLSIVPKTIVYIRCVPHKDRAMAVGFSSFLISMLGWMLGPIVFGYIIDGMCVVWDITCETVGRCLRYDNQMFRLRLHGFGAAGFTLSLICNCLALLYAWWTRCLDEVDGDGGAVTAEMILMGRDHKDKHADEILKAGTTANDKSSGTVDKV